MPLTVINDPRLKNTVSMADLEKQAVLTGNVKSDIDSLHRAVNQIRGLRANLVALQKPAGGGAPNSDVVAAANALDQKMTAVEEVLVQVKIKSSEGNLRYPNMLNEQYASFSDLIQSFDQAPTASQLQVFDELHTRLTAQLAQWQRLQASDIPALNDTLRKNGGTAVTVGNGQGE